MTRQERHISLRGMIIAVFVFINAIIISAGYTESEKLYWLLPLSISLMFVALWMMRQKRSDVS